MPGGRPRGGGSTATRNAGIGGEIVTGPRSTRNKRKSYVLESTSSEEDEAGDAANQGYDDEDEDEDARVAAGGASGLRRGAGRKARNSAARAHNDELDDESEEDEDDGPEADSDGDVEMDDETVTVPVNPRPGPKILRVNGPAPPKPKFTVTPAAAGNGKLQSVESKEIEMAEADDNEDDDEELSEPGSDEDAEGDEDDEEEEDEEGNETMEADAEAIKAMKARNKSNLGGEEGDEEEEEDGEEDDDEDDDDEEGDEDEDNGDQSRASTPDISRMTKRQRSRFDLNGGTESPAPGATGTGIGGADDFLQLPMEPQIKKHLTAEEHAMRRAEMARRRKNLSEKRNEEEKMDTINRLLKKQAPKRRGKISAAEIEAQDRADDISGQGETGAGTEQADDEEVEMEPANPVFVRWVCNKDGSRVGVPEEWLGTPVGKIFGEKSVSAESAKMVEVVEG